MSKEKISSLSICVLLFSLTQATFLGIGFHYVFMNQQPIAILNVILGIIIGYLIVSIYLKVMDVYRYKPEEICAIGDQLVTDIYGANRLDITTILVNPVSSKDSLYGSVNRKLEKAIIKKLAKNEVFVRGKYYE